MNPNDNFISSLFRQEVLEMSAYKVADADGFIKLDAMENPYSWPDPLTEQWLKTLRACELNRYPDAEARQLSDTLKSVNQVPESYELLLGNGSDEIIQILLMALPQNASVLTVEPGFVMYRQISRSLGLNYIGVDLDPVNFELDLPSLLSAIVEYKPAVIFLAYPNNPTGNLFDPQSIRKIIETAPGMVVIDEAYAPFAKASFMEALNNYGNLLVMRTLSKFGLAGLRLGYLAGRPEIIEQLNKIRLPYNINILTQCSARFALEHHEVFIQQADEICLERTLLIEELSKLPAIEVYPSSANFVLFKTLRHDATAVFQHLKEQQILLKNLSPQAGALTNCLRVTIGKEKENKAFLNALKRSLL